MFFAISSYFLIPELVTPGLHELCSFFLAEGIKILGTDTGTFSAVYLFSLEKGSLFLVAFGLTRLLLSYLFRMTERCFVIISGFW
jgi:hypothetical protein